MRSQIKDLVQLGGPRLEVSGPSGVEVVANVALGVRTLKEYKDNERQERADEEADAEARRLKAMAIAQAEARVREGPLRVPTGASSEPETKSNALHLPVPHEPAGSVGPSLPPMPESPAADAAQHIVVAKYAHDVEADEDLEFAEGDHIAVISIDESGYVAGTRLAATLRRPGIRQHVPLMDSLLAACASLHGSLPL